MNEFLLFRIFECVAVVFETFIVQQYLNALFHKRYNGYKLLLGYALWCLGLMFLSLFVPNPFILLFYTIIGIYVLEYTFYKSGILLKVFYAILFGIMMIISEIICSGIVSVLSNVDLMDIQVYGMTRVLVIVVTKLVQIMLVKLVGTIIGKESGESVHLEVKLIFPLLLCQLICIWLAHHIFLTVIKIEGGFDFLTFLSMLGILYIQIVVFWYFDRIKSTLELKNQNEAAETKMELQKQYYNLLDEHQKEINALRHDMEKHIMLIKELQNEGHKEISESYIHDLERQMAFISYVIHTSEPVVSALLTIEAKKAASCGIRMNLEVKLISKVKISPADLCVLIGNVFDNAIKACMMLPSDSDKYINAEIFQKGSMLLISVKNPYFPEGKKETKNDRHGYGLKNIEKVIKKYGGDKPMISKDNGIFYIRIIIP